MNIFDIVDSLNESDSVDDFVAIGNIIDDDNNAKHAAFVIQSNNTLYEFHYTGREIEYQELENNYYHKVTNTIHPDEVPAFISMCNNIMKNANPVYGFFLVEDHIVLKAITYPVMVKLKP